MKMNFGYFDIQKIISQTVWTEKVCEKHGVTCPVCKWLSWAMVLKLSKIVFFLQLYAESTKKSRSVMAIYV